MTTLQAKKWLRKHLIRRRQSLSSRERILKSRLIAKNLFKRPEFKRARVVAAFLSFGSEVLTEGIINECWRRGKTVVIPMTPLGFHQPFFAVFHPGESLRKTSRGPWELQDMKEPFPWKSIDLVLTPGLGFDEEGFRLGFGGGVYDRVLSKTLHASHVGLFYECQKILRLPRERHDKPLDEIISESLFHYHDFPGYFHTI